MSRSVALFFLTATLFAVGSRSTPTQAQSAPSVLEELSPSSSLIDLGARSGTIAAALSSEALATPSLEAERPNASYAWLADLALSDLPVRWNDEVLRNLLYFRDSTRGRNLMSGWLQRSTRYGEIIRETLQRHSLPEDLRCVAMAESGFDPTVRSYAGAAGMWQFVSATGKEYGLEQSHWVDQRLDPARSTDAAARYFKFLKGRLGSWELTLAAYNMGYGALLRAIRKYNTNDYWLLASLEAGLPFETTQYVAKILACSVVMRNPTAFGYGELERDPPWRLQSVEVSGGIRLNALATAAGMSLEELQALNPELLRGRIPPGDERYPLRLPVEKVEEFAQAWTRRRPSDPLTQSYTVRFGEDLGDIAYRFSTGEKELRELNELDESESLGAGMMLVVPAREPREREEDEGSPPVAAVPATHFRYRGRERIFYETRRGDTLDAIASFFELRKDQLLRWNHIDAEATMDAGLLLQLFVRSSFDLERAIVLKESEVRVLVVGSEAFFRYHEDQAGRVRFRYRVQAGDTMKSLSKRFDLSVGSIARINRFSRYTDLAEGQEIIVYADPSKAPREASATDETAIEEPRAQLPEGTPETATVVSVTL